MWVSTPRRREITLLLHEGVDYYIRRAAPSRLAVVAHIQRLRVYRMDRRDQTWQTTSSRYPVAVS
jgi:hypothetical protein